MNALRHGLSAVTALLPGEDVAELDALRRGMFGSYRPRPGAEALLVDRLVSIAWRLRRVGPAEERMAQAADRDWHLRWTTKRMFIVGSSEESAAAARRLGMKAGPQPGRRTGGELLGDQFVWEQEQDGPIVRLALFEAKLSGQLLAVMRQLEKLQKSRPLRGQEQEPDAAAWYDAPPDAQQLAAAQQEIEQQRAEALAAYQVDEDDEDDEGLDEEQRAIRAAEQAHNEAVIAIALGDLRRAKEWRAAGGEVGTNAEGGRSNAEHRTSNAERRSEETGAAAGEVGMKAEGRREEGAKASPEQNEATAGERVYLEKTMGGATTSTGADQNEATAGAMAAHRPTQTAAAATSAGPARPAPGVFDPRFKLPRW